MVQKKGRGKKQQVSESSRLLNVLYNEGLRRQDLDADCRHFLETSPEDVKAKVRASSVSRLHWSDLSTCHPTQFHRNDKLSALYTGSCPFRRQASGRCREEALCILNHSINQCLKNILTYKDCKRRCHILRDKVTLSQRNSLAGRAGKGRVQLI